MLENNRKKNDSNDYNLKVPETKNNLQRVKKTTLFDALPKHDERLKPCDSYGLTSLN